MQEDCGELWEDFTVRTEGAAFLETPGWRIHVNIFVSLQKDLGKQSDCPYMCAYKLVTVKFKWWGLQNKVENFIQKVSSGLGRDVGMGHISSPTCCTGMPLPEILHSVKAGFNLLLRIFLTSSGALLTFSSPSLLLEKSVLKK